MSKIGEKVKAMLRDWLQIQPALEQGGILIQEVESFPASVMRNKIWYRGDANELTQLYKQLGDPRGCSAFWAKAPQDGSIRKMHSGLPSLIVDTLAYLVKTDLDDVQFKGGTGESVWKEITGPDGIDFEELIGSSIVDGLVCGDGAFKISIDETISPYPLVEFYPADQVEYDTIRGKITAINFYSTYFQNKRPYHLREHYAPGSVTYALYDGDTEISLDSVKELASLRPVEFDTKLMLAVPLRFYKNPKFPERGKSIYETKSDDFDAFDEVVSQWMDALRAGRVAKYIPADMIPHNPQNGALKTTAAVNAFGTNFIKVESLLNENGKQGQIDVVQPEIRYEAFLYTYTAILDMCLQGIVSPATLGIDLGKMASAESQRERKDVTGNTRNTITGTLEKVLPKLITALLSAYDLMQDYAPSSYEPVISFGEYGAPSFDSRIDTIGKAATDNTMSIETQVEELWGSSKDAVWKAEEVARIKALRGIEVIDAPGIGDELA